MIAEHTLLSQVQVRTMSVCQRYTAWTSVALECIQRCFRVSWLYRNSFPVVLNRTSIQNLSFRIVSQAAGRSCSLYNLIELSPNVLCPIQPNVQKITTVKRKLSDRISNIAWYFWQVSCKDCQGCSVLLFDTLFTAFDFWQITLTFTLYFSFISHWSHTENVVVF